jgi:hypothetical protein
MVFSQVDRLVIGDSLANLAAYVIDVVALPLILAPKRWLGLGDPETPLSAMCLDHPTPKSSSGKTLESIGAIPLRFVSRNAPTAKP